MYAALEEALTLLFLAPVNQTAMTRYIRKKLTRHITDIAS
jgi:hypothetical protein